MSGVLVEILLDKTAAAAAWLANGYCKAQKDIRCEESSSCWMKTDKLGVLQR